MSDNFVCIGLFWNKKGTTVRSDVHLYYMSCEEIWDPRKDDYGLSDLRIYIKLLSARIWYDEIIYVQ